MKNTSSPQDNSRAALLHDHNTYCIPEEPAALKSLVKDLKDTVHHQAELLLRLREAAEATQMERQELQEKAGDRNWTLVSELGERISQLETENQNLSCKLDQQETTGRLRKELDASGATVLSLSRQLRGLHKALAHHGAFSLETIKSSTKWLRFYTGFDGYPRLMNFLDFLLDGKEGDEGNPDNALQSALTPENQLFLVLVRLRLGLLLQDLAFRFHISESTASRYWLNWTEILEQRLRQNTNRFARFRSPAVRRYVDAFKPQRRLRLHGMSLVALDCAELFFEAQRGARGKRDAQRGPRAHYSVHGWALAAPSGFLTFGAGTSDELPTLPPFLQDGPVDLTASRRQPGGEC
ncbi:hypothetical protein JRQ81_005890 [Phrynocephalus forsythii]|uniref:Transposase Helix-turn-helix domain-containing protein n=1 Tax=Phrynocephalus forsythii TaxID=171643 RepID=A0A9Q0XHJ2_9SAUR|nr:hypothetical protein JRQ81_005890 [Phrynocephalus forsythii]